VNARLPRGRVEHEEPEQEGLAKAPRKNKLAKERQELCIQTVSRLGVLLSSLAPWRDCFSATSLH
jgi:hypothetical protein